MKGKIIPIFPKCYYVRDNVCDDLLPEFTSVVGTLKTKTARTVNFNVNSSHSFENKLYKIKPFDILSKEIMISAREYMLTYGYPHHRIDNAFIQTMWFNVSNKGDFLFPHAHPGSFLSGAYYIKTTPENHILFHDEQKNFYEDPENINDLSTTVQVVKCTPGRLLLFSSDFQHSTPLQINDGEKIVISFNIVLENRR